MMEESGIETTPPASPLPPPSMAAAVNPPPLTMGKSFIDTVDALLPTYVGSSTNGTKCRLYVQLWFGTLPKAWNCYYKSARSIS